MLAQARAGADVTGTRQPGLKPGTRLVRQWKGKVHRVLAATAHMPRISGDNLPAYNPAQPPFSRANFGVVRLAVVRVPLSPCTLRNNREFGAFQRGKQA